MKRTARVIIDEARSITDLKYGTQIFKDSVLSGTYWFPSLETAKMVGISYLEFGCVIKTLWEQTVEVKE